jgi:IS5 family transposase
MTQIACETKTTYRITNWSKYNESLVRRGDVTFWFDEEVLAAWKHENAERKVGRPFVYSDRAIESLLMLRELFRLPYRQTEGLGRALAKLLQAEIAIPDFTSLAKRAGKTTVAFQLDRAATGPIDVVVDSTGLKVYGEGEWKVRQHGVGKRRTWRKLHLAVNPATHEIVAQTLTNNGAHDADQVEPLLEQVAGEVQTLYGDGAYDQWKVYEGLEQRGVDAIIPPRKNARIKQHGNSAADPLPRDECLRQIRRDGRKAWKQSIGYHRRSLAETAVHRLKACFGGTLKNRNLENQQTEVSLRCKLLNLFVTLGMPAFLWS